LRDHFSTENSFGDGPLYGSSAELDGSSKNPSPSSWGALRVPETSRTGCPVHRSRAGPSRSTWNQGIRHPCRRALDQPGLLEWPFRRRLAAPAPWTAPRKRASSKGPRDGSREWPCEAVLRRPLKEPFRRRCLCAAWEANPPDARRETKSQSKAQPATRHRRSRPSLFKAPFRLERNAIAPT
jgi:hypothetical protein